MDSAQETLIAIASASQRVIDVLVLCARDRNDRNLDLSHKQLAGDLQRIVAASQTLLRETLEHSPSADPAVDDRLEMWLSSREPKTCLDTLQGMEALIKSNSSIVSSTFRNIFHSVPVKDKLKQAIRIFEKTRVYFYFLLNTNVWDRETATMGRPRGHSINTQSIRQDLVDRSTNSVGQFWKKKFWSEMDRTRLKEISEWLDAWDCTEKHEDTLELRQPDTCTWLPDTDEYQTWRYANDAFLWLHGKPGSGKSVLAASVIDHIHYTMDTGELLVFFYCDFRSERSTVAAEVMRSLLSQLLQGLGDLGVDPGDTLDVLAKEKRQKHTILGKAKRLAVLVSHVAKQYPHPPLVVVDALDECKLEDIENLLGSLLDLNDGGMRLLVISRPVQVIKSRFSGLPWLSLEQMPREVYADIRLHVRREVDSHSRLRDAGAILKEEIIQTLCRKADGMFRWIECQLNTLKRCFTTSEIWEVLDSLPVGLEATYQQILLAVSKEERGGVIAKRALMWIVTAFRPLRLCQVLEALSIDLDQRTLNSNSAPIHGGALLDSLSSLVIHSEEGDVVTLSHFSVKEYLVGNVMEENPTHHIDLRDAHAQVAQQCMSYIAACLTLRLQDSNDHPLLDYVLDHGFCHLSYVEPTDRILDSVVALHRDIQQHPLEWEQLRGWRKGFPVTKLPSLQDDFVLYILIRYAPDPLLQLFLCRSPLAEKEGINPLIYTVPGKVEHARTLLAHGAKLGVCGEFVELLGSALPIEVAATNGDSELFDLFLEEGSPVPYRLVSGQHHERWCLDPFCSNAHIFSRLLQTDEFMECAINVLDEKLFIPTLQGFAISQLDQQGSADGDTVAIARRLKQLGCDLAGHTSFVEALLRNAAKTGDISSIQHLLLDFEMQLPPDILLRATESIWGCRSLNADTIRFLIRNGANIYAVSVDESTPLHYTVRLGGMHDRCLGQARVLCEAGCSPSACNLLGETPMHIAVNRGDLSVVRHLHSVSAFLPPDILFSITPFTASSLSSFMHMTRFLLGTGGNAKFVAANGDSVLHLALNRNLAEDSEYAADCLEYVRMLVAAGCDLRITNSFGQTSLDIAAAKGHISVVKFFLSLNMPLSSGPGIANSFGQTSLNIAVAHGQISVVKYFLSLNIPLSPDILLLTCRAFRFYRDSADFAALVRLLLRHGADPNASTPDGDNVLHLAMTTGSGNWDSVRTRNGWPDIASWDEEQYKFQVAKTLVEAGCDPSACNINGRTVLHTVAAEGFMKIMEYLLSLGIPIPSDILLFLSDSLITAQVIQLLIDKGADIRAVTGNGDTPLHRAARAAPNPFVQTQAIQLLLDRGADVRAVTADGVTPLHCAVSQQAFFPESASSSLKFAELLIAAGSDPCAFSVAHKTPMHVAAARGNISVINYLLSLSVPLPLDILLTAASESDRLMTATVVRFLVDKGADTTAVTAEGDTALHLVLSGPGLGGQFSDLFKLETVQILIEAGCDINACNSAGDTPLLFAASFGYLNITMYLLSRGASLHPQVFLAAAICGAIDIMEYLLSQGTLVPPSAFLAAASYQGFTNKVQVIRLVSTLDGADVSVVAPNGDTPLHCTLAFGDEDVCLETAKLLVDLGCHPSLCNSAGETPLHIAARRHHIPVLKYLLSQEIPLPSDVLLSAVYYEFFLGSGGRAAAMIRLLIREGANPCVVNDEGDTPLHVLLRQKFSEDAMQEWKIIQMLLDAGANPYARNLDGQTPVDLAEKPGPFFAKNFMRLVEQAKAPIVPRHN